jgi:hypothetical protein
MDELRINWRANKSGGEGRHNEPLGCIRSGRRPSAEPWTGQRDLPTRCEPELGAAEVLQRNMNRDEVLAGIKNSPEVSVLVVGAGINGIGTFRDLALNGVDVLLIDRSDFCSGASAASSHMAHGGIRYLENGEFRLVREAVQERNGMIEDAPHIVKPLPTTIPIFNLLSGLLNAPLKFMGLLDRPSERGSLVIKIGLMLYDAYTGEQRTVPRHRFLGRKESLRRWPKLSPAVVHTATYYDGAILQPGWLASDPDSGERALGMHEYESAGETAGNRGRAEGRIMMSDRGSC